MSDICELTLPMTFAGVQGGFSAYGVEVSSVKLKAVASVMITVVTVLFRSIGS